MPAASYGVQVSWIAQGADEIQTRQAAPEDATYEPDKTLAELREFYHSLVDVRAKRLVDWDEKHGYRTRAHAGSDWQLLPEKFHPGGYY